MLSKPSNCQINVNNYLLLVLENEFTSFLPSRNNIVVCECRSYYKEEILNEIANEFALILEICVLRKFILMKENLRD